MFKITIFIRPRDGFNFREWFEEEELQDELPVYFDFDEDYEEGESEVCVLSGMGEEAPIEGIIDLFGDASDLVIEWYSNNLPSEKIEDPAEVGTVEDGDVIAIYGDCCGVYNYIETEPCCYRSECKLMTPQEFFDREPAFW